MGASLGEEAAPASLEELEALDCAVCETRLSAGDDDVGGRAHQLGFALFGAHDASERPTHESRTVESVKVA